MALTPDTLTTNTPTRCSPSSNARMPPMGFQTSLIPGEYMFNSSQCLPQLAQSDMPCISANTALPASTITNSTAPTAWIDTYPTAPSYSLCPHASAMGQTTAYDFTTTSLQGTGEPSLPMLQVEDDRNILGSPTRARLPVQMSKRCRSSSSTRSQSMWPRRCEWSGCDYPGTFNRKADLMRHVEEKHVAPGSYRCPVRCCQRLFNRHYNLRNHIRAKH